MRHVTAYFAKLRSLIFLITLVMIGFAASAQSLSPQGLNLQGRIVKPDGSAVEATNVNFVLQIRSPGAESCLLFEETHSLNMSGTDGLFSLTLGSGTRAGTNFKDISTMKQIFDNSAASITPLNCASGTSYDPSTLDSRKLRISFDDGSGVQTLAQDQTIQAVPYAIAADSVQGKTPTDFVQTITSLESTPGTTQTRVNQIVDTDWAGLNALLAGTSTLYAKAVPTGAVDYNNQRIVNVANPTSPQDAATKDYSDTKIGGNAAVVGVLAPGDVGKALTWDGTKWVAQTPSTMDVTKLPLAGGTMTGAINMGAQNITNAGHVQLGLQKTLLLGRYDNTQETALISTLLAADNGRVWFNTDTSKQRLWNGTAAVDVGSSTLVVGTTAGTAMGADAVPNCTAAQKLQMSLGPTYSWTCVTDTATQWTTAGADIYFNTGNVGIGTSTPTHLGHIVSQNISSDVPLAVMQPNLGWSSSVGIRLGRAEASTQSGNISYTWSGAGPANRTLNFGHWDNSKMMVIDENGNVGIGTTAPGFKLDVNGGGYFGGGLMTNWGNATTPGYSLSGGGGMYQVAANTVGFATSNTERLRIDSTGKIGIGAISPTALLTLKAGSTAAGTAPLKLTAGTNLTTPEAGAIEFDGTNLYYTDSTNTRKTLGTGSGSGDFKSDGSVSMTAPLKASNGTASVPSFTFDSDTNTGFFRPASDTIAFTASGDETMRISATGNVGIGTTSPLERLDVRGSVLIGEGNYSAMISGRGDGRALYATGLYLDSSAAPGQFKTAYNHGSYGYAGIYQSYGNTSFFNSSAATTAGATVAPSPSMVITNLGKVGIGTTSPTAALTLKAGTAAAGTAPLKLTSGTNLTTPEVGAIEFDGTNLYYTNSSNARQTLATETNGAGDFKKDGSVAMTGNFQLGTNVMNQDGSAGIGLSFGSGGRVDIAGTSGGRNSALTLRNTSGASGSSAALDFQSSSVNTARLDAVVGANTNDVDLAISTRGSSSMSEKMRITSSGNVGIGTTSPTNKLEVVGSATFSTGITVGNGGVNTSGSAVTGPGTVTSPAFGFLYGGSGTGFYQPGGAGSEIVGITTAGAERMRINAAGNVGIGTATPTETLEVAGGILASSTSGSSINITIKNAATVTGSAAGLFFKNSSVTGSSLSSETMGGNIYDLIFRTRSGGVTDEKLRITGTGNVGIGVTSPARLLHVNGPIRVTAAALPTGATGDIAIDSADSNKLKWYNGASWQTAGGGGVAIGQTAGTAVGADAVPNCTSTQKLQMSAGPTFAWTCVADGSQWTTSGSDISYVAGKVGIGTTTPSLAMEINRTTAGLDGLYVQNLSSATNAGGYFGMANDAGKNIYLANTSSGFTFNTGAWTTNAAILGTDATAGLSVVAESAAPIRLFTGGGALTNERMRIDTGGNVGIGTAAPAQKLSVAGTIESTSGGVKFPDGTVQTTAAQTTFLAGIGATTIPASSTAYFGFAGSGSSTTEGLRQLPIPVAGKLKNFFLRISGAQPGSGDLTCTVRLNGASTSLNVVIAAGTIGGQTVDSANVVTVSAGQWISLQCINAATGVSTAIAGYSLVIEK